MALMRGLTGWTSGLMEFDVRLDRVEKRFDDLDGRLN
jgi:hypothetical protein